VSAMSAIYVNGDTIQGRESVRIISYFPFTVHISLAYVHENSCTKSIKKRYMVLVGIYRNLNIQ